MDMHDPRIAAPRTLDELKAEVILRVKSKGYPGRALSLAPAESAMKALNSLDPDAWAGVWIAEADTLMDQADGTADASARGELLKQAYELYTMGRFPARTSPGKQRAYEKSLTAYLAYTATLPQPMEVVRIPFEGKEIVAYLRTPDGPGPFPLMIQCGGLDYLKEQIADEALLFTPKGFAVLAMDMPGTGQAPILADVGGERMFSRAFDWAETRPEIDAKKMFMRGVSWGGHWATRVAFAEKDRVLGAINHGGAVHHFFTTEWQLKALGTREYLMGLFDARSAIFGVKTLDEFLAYGPRMSMLVDDRIDGPCAPMLVMNGVKDTQVPIADHILLISRGDAKDAWFNPKGMHMGFSADWSSVRVNQEIIIPWFRRRIEFSDMDAPQARATRPA
jgi:pimeloyl-ACP methyl ester carboxylesterase